MRRIKILAILAATALVAIGVFGVASASAGTVLCSEPDKATCAPSAVLPKGSTIETFAFASSETDNFRFRLRDVTFNQNILGCRDNEIDLTTTMKNGNPLPAQFQPSVDPTECRWRNSLNSVCSSVTVSTPPTTIEAGGAGGGIASVGSTSQPLTVAFTCKFKFAGIFWTETCEYQASGTTEMELYPGPGEGVIFEPVTRISGSSFCGEEGNSFYLIVQNEIHPPSSPNISEATETVLCAVSRIQASPCPNAQIKPAGTQFFTGQPHQKGGLWLDQPHRVASYLSCPATKGQTVMWFGTGEEAGAPLEVGAEMFGSAAACSFWNGEGTCSNVTIGAAESPEEVSATMESTGVSTARIKLGTTANPFVVGFTCSKTPGGPSQTCAYWSGSTPVNMDINYTGWPFPTVMGVAKASLVRISGDPKLCDESVQLTLESMVDQKSAINIV